MTAPLPRRRELGSLGDFAFGISRRAQRVVRTRRWRRAAHPVLGGDALESTGRDLDEVTLRIRLSAVEGESVDPADDLAALREAGDAGTVLPLFVGEVFWGWYVLDEMRDEARHVRPTGEVLSAEANLRLLEVPDDQLEV